MFGRTFFGCSNLTSFTDGTKTTTYVPASFLSGISDGSASDQVYQMFAGSGLTSTCSTGTTDVTRTQFNDAGKPWCSECPSGTISPAGSTSDSQCVVPLTVTYACGTGATGDAPTDANSYFPNATVTTVDSFGTCAKSGYFASGWVCDGTSVVNGGTFTITADTTCTTQWSGNSIDLTWDGGGTPAMCTYGGTFNVPTPTTITGYVFTGWSQTVPTGYTELKYIQSSGTQYIDTGFAPDNTGYKHTIVFDVLSSGTGYLCGTGSSGGRSGNVKIESYVISGIYIGLSSARQISSGNPSVSGTKNTLEMNLNANATCPITLNGTAINNTTTGPINSSNSLKLFTSGGSSIPFRIYHDSIYQNGAYIHNFIPAKRNSDNAIGMWDTVTRTFFTNAGSGTFTAGPAVQ